MKEAKLIEMSNKIDTTGRVLNQMITEIKMLDDRIAGIYAFLQSMPNYEEIVEELKEKAKENEQEQKEK